MRPLTLEAFKIIYTITGAQRFSYYFALVFNTLLTYLVVKGICTLLMGIFSFLGLLSIVFRFPFYAGTLIAIFFINMKVVPFEMVDFVDSIKTKYAKLIIFIALAILLYFYDWFIARYFA